MTEIIHSLDTLAVRVREAHAEVEEHGRATVAAAIRAGEALIEAKAAVTHGAWLPWLAENFPASRDTAANYMRLAENVERVPHLAAAGSMREALALVAGPPRGPRDSDPESGSPASKFPGQTDLVTDATPEGVIQVTHYEPVEPPEPTHAPPADDWGSTTDAEEPEVVDAEPVEVERESSRDRRTQAVIRAAQTLHVPTLTHPEGLAYALPRMSARDRESLAESVNFILARSRAASKIVKQFEENHA